MLEQEKIILIDKPKGMTSHDVVSIIRKKLNIKKVGHTGTLDPIATGLMVVLTGKYTKLSNYLTNDYKEYIATVKLGIKTDTLDITGKVLESKKCFITKEKLEEVLDSFEKEYDQTVPIFSAVKIHGKKLYDYARENKEVDLPTRKVDIKKIKLLDFKEDEFSFQVLVSKGTYIRSLISDICTSLEIIGTMKDLRRIKQGIFDIKDSNKLEEVDSNIIGVKLEDIIDEKIIIDEVDYKKVKNGNKLNIKIKNDFVKLFYKNKMVALYKSIGEEIKPIIVL